MPAPDTYAVTMEPSGLADGSPEFRHVLAQDIGASSGKPRHTTRGSWKRCLWTSALVVLALVLGVVIITLITLASLRNAGMDALKDDDGNPTTKMDVSFQNDTLLTSMQARLQPLSNYHGAEFMLAGCDVYDTTRGTEQRKRLGTLTITPQKRCNARPRQHTNLDLEIEYTNLHATGFPTRVTKLAAKCKVEYKLSLYGFIATGPTTSHEEFAIDLAATAAPYTPGTHANSSCAEFLGLDAAEALKHMEVDGIKESFSAPGGAKGLRLSMRRLVEGMSSCHLSDASKYVDSAVVRVPTFEYSAHVKEQPRYKWNVSFGGLTLDVVNSNVHGGNFTLEAYKLHTAEEELRQVAAVAVAAHTSNETATAGQRHARAASAATTAWVSEFNTASSQCKTPSSGGGTSAGKEIVNWVWPVWDFVSQMWQYDHSTLVWSTADAPQLLPYGLGLDHTATGQVTIGDNRVCVNAAVDADFIKSGGCLNAEGNTFYSGNFEHYMKDASHYNAFSKLLFPDNDHFHISASVNDLQDGESLMQLSANFVEGKNSHQGRMSFTEGGNTALFTSDFDGGHYGSDDFRMNGTVRGSITDSGDSSVSMELAINNFELRGDGKQGMGATFAYNDADTRITASLRSACTPLSAGATQTCTAKMAVADDGDTVFSVAINDFSLTDKKDGKLSMTASAAVGSDDKYTLGVPEVSWDVDQALLTYRGVTLSGDSIDNDLSAHGMLRWFSDSKYTTAVGFDSDNCGKEAGAADETCVNVHLQYTEDTDGLETLEVTVEPGTTDSTFSLRAQCQDPSFPNFPKCSGHVQATNEYRVDVRDFQLGFGDPYTFLSFDPLVLGNMEKLVVSSAITTYSQREHRYAYTWGECVGDDTMFKTTSGDSCSEMLDMGCAFDEYEMNGYSCPDHADVDHLYSSFRKDGSPNKCTAIGYTGYNAYTVCPQCGFCTERPTSTSTTTTTKPTEPGDFAITKGPQDEITQIEVDMFKTFKASIDTQKRNGEKVFAMSMGQTVGVGFTDGTLNVDMAMTSFEEEYDKTAQDYVKVGKTTKLVSAWTGELRDLQWDGTVSYDGPDEGDEMKGESRFGCVDTMATTKTCDMHTSMYGGCGKKLSACDFKMLMTMTDKMIIRDANDVLEVGGRVEMKMQTKIDPQTDAALEYDTDVSTFSIESFKLDNEAHTHALDVDIRLAGVDPISVAFQGTHPPLEGAVFENNADCKSTFTFDVGTGNATPLLSLTFATLRWDAQTSPLITGTATTTSTLRIRDDDETAGYLEVGLGSDHAWYDDADKVNATTTLIVTDTAGKDWAFKLNKGSLSRNSDGTHALDLGWDFEDDASGSVNLGGSCSVNTGDNVDCASSIAITSDGSHVATVALTQLKWDMPKAGRPFENDFAVEMMAFADADDPMKVTAMLDWEEQGGATHAKGGLTVDGGTSGDSVLTNLTLHHLYSSPADFMIAMTTTEVSKKEPEYDYIYPIWVTKAPEYDTDVTSVLSAWSWRKDVPFSLSDLLSFKIARLLSIMDSMDMATSVCSDDIAVNLKMVATPTDVGAVEYGGVDKAVLSALGLSLDYLVGRGTSLTALCAAGYTEAQLNTVVAAAPEGASFTAPASCNVVGADGTSRVAVDTVVPTVQVSLSMEPGKCEAQRAGDIKSNLATVASSLGVSNLIDLDHSEGKCSSTSASRRQRRTTKDNFDVTLTFLATVTAADVVSAVSGINAKISKAGTLTISLTVNSKPVVAGISKLATKGTKTLTTWITVVAATGATTGATTGAPMTPKAGAPRATSSALHTLFVTAACAVAGVLA